ncbi:MAG: prolyl oligopeptidase family serine peptidase [Rhodomicrobium sp.]
MPTIDPRPTTQDPSDDPYLWLENIEGEAALAWVEHQNARTLERYAGSQFEADRDALAFIFDCEDKIPYIRRRAGLVYNFWQDAGHPRGLWRRTTLAEYHKDVPSWEPLLDLDALATAECEDWVWHGADTLQPLHNRAILSLSRGGSDAAVLREYDLVQKCFVEGGFELPEAKSSAQWLDADTLLLSTALGGGDAATRSGYARQVRLWRRGTDPLSGPLLFEVGKESMGAYANIDKTAPGERIWFSDQVGFFEAERWLGGRRGPQQKLELPKDAWLGFHHDWFVLKTRSPWTIGGATYGVDTLLGGSLSGLLNGTPALKVLFEGAERTSLQSFFWLRGRLYLDILDNLKPRFEVLLPSPQGWTSLPIADLPEATIISLWPLDVENAESNGDLLLGYQDPLTPPTLALLSDGAASVVVLKRAPTDFRATGLTVTRHEVVSVDGEYISYTQIGPVQGTGDAPTLMTGYGGFCLSELAGYDQAVGKLWLERGGTFVVANIRGGGEFGTRWHEAGRRAGKRLSHDDFAAVATDLVRRGVTVPERIAAEGGSNGGILISNMLTRYPERFGALFCTIPLIDMYRYSHLLAGASWIDEYGDPDKPEDWAFLKTYSAYHNAEPGQNYPPILLATTRRDDRVHPGHARKMAAKLQAMGYEAYFYEPAAGGHGYGKDNKERAALVALGYRFLRQTIGWSL